MALLLRDIIPDDWGQFYQASDTSIAKVEAGPGISAFTLDEPFVIVSMKSAQKEIGFGSDKRVTVDDEVGSIKVWDRQLEYYSKWDGMCNTLTSSISNERLKSLAAATYDRDDIELHLPKPGVSSKKIHAIARLMSDEMDAFDTTSSLALDALQTVFWHYIIREYSSLSPRRPKLHRGGLSPHALGKILDYIHEHMAEKITLDALAEAAGLSTSHFVRAFRATTGSTPHLYLTNLRLDRANNLIQGNKLGLQEIAAICGFSSHSHLTSRMKQYWGITPGQLRL